MKKYIKPTLNVIYIDSQELLGASGENIMIDTTSEDTYDLGGALTKGTGLWEDEDFE